MHRRPFEGRHLVFIMPGHWVPPCRPVGISLSLLYFCISYITYALTCTYSSLWAFVASTYVGPVCCLLPCKDFFIMYITPIVLCRVVFITSFFSSPAIFYLMWWTHRHILFRFYWSVFLGIALPFVDSPCL